MSPVCPKLGSTLPTYCMPQFPLLVRLIRLDCPEQQPSSFFLLAAAEAPSLPVIIHGGCCNNRREGEGNWTKSWKILLLLPLKVEEAFLPLLSLVFKRFFSLFGRRQKFPFSFEKGGRSLFETTTFSSLHFSLFPSTRDLPTNCFHIKPSGAKYLCQVNPHNKKIFRKYF